MSTHAAHVEFHDLLIVVAVRHLDVLVRLYAAVAGAFAVAAGVIAHHVLEIFRHAVATIIRYRHHGVIANGAVLCLLHFQLVHVQAAVLAGLQLLIVLPAQQYIFLVLIGALSIMHRIIVIVVTLPSGTELIELLVVPVHLLPSLREGVATLQTIPRIVLVPESMGRRNVLQSTLHVRELQRVLYKVTRVSVPVYHPFVETAILQSIFELR